MTKFITTVKQMWFLLLLMGSYWFLYFVTYNQLHALQIHLLNFKYFKAKSFPFSFTLFTKDYPNPTLNPTSLCSRKPTIIAFDKTYKWKVKTIYLGYEMKPYIEYLQFKSLLWNYILGTIFLKKEVYYN